MAADDVAQRIGQLESDDFKHREIATKALAQHVEQIAPQLRKALKVARSAELKKRLQAILRLLEGPVRFDPEAVRHLRAIAALERIDSSTARAILARLAGGVPTDRRTRVAVTALRRHKRRARP